MRYTEERIDMGAGPRRFRSYIPDGFSRSPYTGKRPGLVIFPGGAYAMTFPGEAEPIALAFAAQGICAFILDYTTAGERYPAWPYPQLEAFEAIRRVRARAEEYGIDPHNIAALGFSAGGHLCACTGTLFNKACMSEYLSGKERESRPDKLVLCYPVIRGLKPCHIGSFENLFGKEKLSEELLTEFSLQNQVDDETPPSFIWSTSEDRDVPPQSALDFSRALADHDVRQELHIYPHGSHGACLGNHVTQELGFGKPMECAAWVLDAVRFLYDDTLTEGRT